MTRPFLAALSIAVISCSGKLFPDTPRFMRTPDRFASLVSSSRPAPDTTESVAGLYATAMVFPSWASWKEGDFRGGRIVLFKDGKELASTPAGDYPDPERHRILDGHLWSDSVEGKETAVCRDGKELFRYEAEERLLGFAVRGDSVFTLGQNPGNRGLSFRLNGEIVFADAAGLVMGYSDSPDWPSGALQPQEGGMYYSYAVPLVQGGEQLMEYRVMNGDRTIKVLQAGSVGHVYDIRVIGGVIYRVEKRTNLATTTCLATGDDYRSLNIIYGESPANLKLCLWNGEVCVKGHSSGLTSEPDCAWCRSSAGIVRLVPSRKKVSDLYVDGLASAWFLSEDGALEGLYDNGRKLMIEDGVYMEPAGRCVLLSGKKLYAALTSLQGDRHLLVSGDKFMDIEFNGYFTGIAVNF